MCHQEVYRREGGSVSQLKKINVEHVFPPIPVREFDYQATYEGYEPGDPIGRGKTEQEAIADLQDAALSRDVYPPRIPHGSLFARVCGKENMLDGPAWNPFAHSFKVEGDQ
jgi:hypothetical protein